jgi:hypothetical protein
MDAGEISVLTQSFELPADLGSPPFQLYVGNNFTGFVHLRLSLGDAPAFDWMPIIAVGSIALVAVVIVFVWKKT